MSTNQVYVIQVTPGAEEHTRQLLLHDLPELAQSCHTPAFTRLLGGTNDRFLPLSSDEVAWLNAFTDVQTHVVGMSEGVIEGDDVRITKGPLRGMEAQIAKIDRHKRLAWLDIRMCGREKQVKVGLEIVRKRP